ncbi:hypothetical protein DPMN_180922 [Dreissena polymorpha]|uniref:Uncharacterized protein n=1 Tax=Dreissena polymorpha TaxID=45954 RepID=A0A9D4I3A2_DREPO|nr:hypothetical protein DPMN_180922 [Dreissena polymorpha]
MTLNFVLQVILCSIRRRSNSVLVVLMHSINSEFSTARGKSSRQHYTSEDTCSTTLPLIDDVIARLYILEIAFKEQTFAKETIAREVSDQTNIYESLEKKIASVLDRLTNISNLFSDLQMRLDQLEKKANFNGMLFHCVCSLNNAQQTLRFEL